MESVLTLGGSTLINKLKAATPEVRAHMLKAALRQWLADFLEVDDLEEIAEDQNFMELGTDSMQAVDFKVKLEGLLKCPLRSTVLFDYPSLGMLAEYLLNDVLQLSTTVHTDAIQIEGVSALKSEAIVIIAAAGIFPDIPDVEALWRKVTGGEVLSLAAPNANQSRDFARVDSGQLKNPQILGISQTEYVAMDRQQQLLYKAIADAFVQGGLSLADISKQPTGVFIAAEQFAPGPATAYQVPIANKLSFQLNFKGPSETVNAFCTSVHVALQRAVQSLQAGECHQALVGGVNIIGLDEFKAANQAGLYENLLSVDNQTKSFCNDAKGYVRSEGAGVLILKPLHLAEQDGNNVLALIRGATVYHGGRGYSYEAPNPQGLKEAIKISFKQAGLSSDNIDYVEAHGIGNIMADALELGAINQAYQGLSRNPLKQWHVSCIKPTLGHPELASGLAALLKAIKALECKVLPGIAGLDTLNNELPAQHALLLQAQNQPWSSAVSPKRVALNSYAIGGLNAHVILEEYCPETAPAEKFILRDNPALTSASIDTSGNIFENNVLRTLVRDIFNLELKEVDYTQSLIDYGFDSIKVMQFVVQLNEQLGLDIKISQVLGVESFAEFFDLLAREQVRVQQAGQASSLTKETPITLAAGIASALSEVQKGLWYVNEIAPESIAFNVPLTFKMPTGVDLEKLEQALMLVLAEYPLLRVSIQEHGNTIMQVIRPVADCINLQELMLAPEQALWPTLQHLLQQSFDLARDSLVRLYVVHTAGQGDYVFFVIHHIVFDGASGALFINAFWKHYHALVAGQPLTVQQPDLAFLDYVNWEHAYLESDQARSDQAWWQAQLSGQAPTINLPYDRLPQTSLSHAGIGCQKLVLNNTALSAWKALASQLKVNLSVLYLAAFQIFLYKLSSETELAVTMPVRGRPKSAHEHSIGCYINVMVVPCMLATETAFAELVKTTRQQFLHCLDHAFYPFPKLLTDLGLTLANPKENPFPVSYTYQNFFDELLNNAVAMQGVEILYDVYQQTEDNYTLEIYDFRDRLQINLKYKRSLFDDSTIIRHLGYFEHLLDAIIKRPEQAIKHFDLLPPTERTHWLTTVNKTQMIWPEALCLHELFARQAAQSPEHIAVQLGEQQLTYRQLEDQSSQLALYLQQQGVLPENLVALCITRSLNMLVALLGILKAGAAYLPIDANDPYERIRSLLCDSEAALLISEQALAEKLSGVAHDSSVNLLLIDAAWDRIAQTQGVLKATTNPAQLAYVIYTSGSTGQPKGVMVEHRNVVNHNLAVIDAYQLTAQDRVLQFSTISFDIFVEEVFPTLLVGATVVLLEGDRFTDVRYLKATIEQQRVSLLNLPTAFWHTLVEESFTGSALRRVVIGGEKAEIAKFEQWRRHNPNIPVINTYGPTETTVIALWGEIPDNLTSDQPIPLGIPLANTQIYVLDADLKLVPTGVQGELYIAGCGVARGYLKQPELTAEKFIANPFGEGRLYKTGDWVRWLPDGQLEYRGRIDDQVKIRGFRVELGEIERILIQHEQVTNAVVVTQKQGQGQQLVAYYQGADTLDESLLHGYLRTLLPDYMIPAALVKLDAIPLTANGKVNRKYLQSQTVAIESHQPYAAPSNAIEMTLAEIWQEVLGIPKVGIHDNFFALGGHSLLAIQIVLRTNKALGVNIALSTLFDAADIQQLGLKVAEAGQEIGEARQTLSTFAEKSEELIF